MSSKLGKIFISHSSTDKPFVRKLVKRLEASGFRVWLDERELLAGDSLSQEIADAVRKAKVIIVVVSPVSVLSKWLKYELNLATSRMIKGTCRVIPVVVADATIPPEVEGLLYADFRQSFKLGAKQLITSLQHEAAQERMRQAMSAPIYVRVNKAVEAVFGPIGSVSASGEYKWTDWQSVSLPIPSDDDPNPENSDSPQRRRERRENPVIAQCELRNVRIAARSENECKLFLNHIFSATSAPLR